jgi:hypothetical protein
MLRGAGQVNRIYCAKVWGGLPPGPIGEIIYFRGSTERRCAAGKNIGSERI